ncbi:hypothetical protein Tco_0218708, partial [Tanacetum coccineum]
VHTFWARSVWWDSELCSLARFGEIPVGGMVLVDSSETLGFLFCAWWCLCGSIDRSGEVPEVLLFLRLGGSFSRTLVSTLKAYSESYRRSSNLSTEFLSSFLEAVVLNLIPQLGTFWLRVSRRYDIRIVLIINISLSTEVLMFYLWMASWHESETALGDLLPVLSHRHPLRKVGVVVGGVEMLLETTLELSNLSIVAHNASFGELRVGEDLKLRVMEGTESSFSLGQEAEIRLGEAKVIIGCGVDIRVDFHNQLPLGFLEFGSLDHSMDEITRSMAMKD